MIRGDWLPDCSLGTGEGVWLVEICRDVTDVTKDWETEEGGQLSEMHLLKRRVISIRKLG